MVELRVQNIVDALNSSNDAYSFLTPEEMRILNSGSEIRSIFMFRLNTTNEVPGQDLFKTAEEVIHQEVPDYERVMKHLNKIRCDLKHGNPLDCIH